jgi:hypothetical protein
MVRAVEKVRQRLLRAAAALEAAGVPYAVIGGNAVASWVARVDKAAVRNTPDVDILLRRSDFAEAAGAIARADFIQCEVAGRTMFLDGPASGLRDAVAIVFAGEKSHPDDLLPAPDVDESEKGEQYRVLSLEALMRMNLTTWSFKDRVHLRDLIGVGLVDASWLARLPAELAARLQQLLDTPEG